MEGIWIGQDGKKYGPYSLADVRHWVAEGRFGATTVAWREGLPDWVPLATLLAGPAHAAPPAMAPPPMAPPPPAFAGAASQGEGGVAAMDARRRDQQPSHASRGSLPPPPSLHWGLVVLFTILTLGIFGIVWPFIQANWVRKIDRHSNATLILGLALGCYVVGYAMIAGATPSADGSGAHPGMAGFGLLLELAYGLLFVYGYFSMAGSIRQRMDAYQVPVAIGGVTLFFFNVWYLQAQLSWLARWQRTGQTEPRASKGVFWLLMLVLPFVAAVLAAIAVPAYEEYVVRAQVASTLSQAEPLKGQIVEAIGRNQGWPQTNAQAGLKEADAYASSNLAGFAVQPVTEGTALVGVFNEHAPVALRNKRLILIAHGQDGAIVWTCQSPDISQRYLPLQCRS